MIWLALTGLIILFCFGFVLIFGAPYLPTLGPQINTALEMADLKPGDTLLELGCGDGKVVIAAAKQGIQVVGFELNPILAIIAWFRTRRYRKSVKIIWGNFWTKSLPSSDAIFVFLLPKFMTKLDNTINDLPNKPINLISFAFKIPNKKIDKKSDGVYLYKYS